MILGVHFELLKFPNFGTSLELLNNILSHIQYRFLMKNICTRFLLLFLIFFALNLSTPVFAQHGIGAKVLFVDYGTPNGLDSLSLTNGGELVYIRDLGKVVNFALPFKAGVANVAGDINNKTFLGLDALLHIKLAKPEGKFIPYLLAGGGIVVENFEDSNVQFPAGLGFNLKVGENAYVNVQGEYRFSLADVRNNIQLGAGFIYQLGKTVNDRDGDGITDEEDSCPDQPGKAETKGCPDADNDGVADNVDLCPNEAGDKAFSGCPDSDGDGIADRDDACPQQAGTKDAKGCPDADGDGVADSLDECPTDAGTINGCPDSDNDGIADKYDDCPNEAGLAANGGCPIKDEDGDGVADSDDECPGEKGTQASRGCPDRDGDGVADKYDNCPDKAGEFSGCPDTDGDGLDDYQDKCPEQAGLADNGGCPEIKKEEQEVLDLAMRAVQFESGRATLKIESYRILNQIGDIMKKYPGYSLLIAGHTDDVGSSSTNQRLSEERARACYDYLSALGIDDERMSYVGYGEDRPIASNSTREGKSLNRRTEFDLYIK